MMIRMSSELPPPSTPPLFVADHTKLSAINTCPLWGIVRYELHKTMPNAGRPMALEAGKAAHLGFAAVRLYQLGYVQNRLDLMQHHGIRIFGEHAFAKIHSVISPTRAPLSNLMNFTIAAFESSGYYDDESDRRRTKDNIIESLMEYCKQWDNRYPVWIRDPSSSTSDVGIETPFELYTTVFDNKGQVHEFIFTGKIDGIHESSRGLFADENKTASRIDDAWIAQWRMSHQITGYCLAASVVTNMRVSEARSIGLQIPLPRSTSNGFRADWVPRDETKHEMWATWVVHTLSLLHDHHAEPLKAPRYTTACNRYFRPCAFLPLCDMPAEEQGRVFAEMVHDEWSPLLDESKVVG